MGVLMNHNQLTTTKVRLLKRLSLILVLTTSICLSSTMVHKWYFIIISLHNTLECFHDMYMLTWYHCAKQDSHYPCQNPPIGNEIIYRSLAYCNVFQCSCQKLLLTQLLFLSQNIPPSTFLLERWPRVSINPSRATNV